MFVKNKTATSTKGEMSRGKPKRKDAINILIDKQTNIQNYKADDKGKTSKVHTF